MTDLITKDNQWWGGKVADVATWPTRQFAESAQLLNPFRVVTTAAPKPLAAPRQVSSGLIKRPTDTPADVAQTKVTPDGPADAVKTPQRALREGDEFAGPPKVSKLPSIAGGDITRIVDPKGGYTYEGKGAEGAESTPFSFVDQLARLRQIDPERYGTTRTTEQPVAGPDFGSMTWGQVAQTVAGRRQAAREADRTLKADIATADRNALLQRSAAELAIQARGQDMQRAKTPEELELLKAQAGHYGQLTKASAASSYEAEKMATLQEAIRGLPAGDAKRAAYERELSELRNRASEQRIREIEAMERAKLAAILTPASGG